jgi:hypothetical protein
LGHFVMTLAILEGRSARPRMVPKAKVEGVCSNERDCDVWPEWSTERAPAELANAAEKNKLSKVLGEVAGAIAYSLGLVVLLMSALSVL